MVLESGSLVARLFYLIPGPTVVACSLERKMENDELVVSSQCMYLYRKS